MYSVLKVTTLFTVVFFLIVSSIFYVSGYQPQSHTKNNPTNTKIKTADTIFNLTADEQNTKKPTSFPEITPTLRNDSILESDLLTILTQQDINPNYPTFADRISTIEARRNGVAVDPQAIWNASNADTPWETLDEAPDSLNLSLDKKLDGREFIKIDPLKIESLVHGDTFELTIQQLNVTFTAHIENVISEDNGSNVTWTGYLEGLESPNTITLTRGSNLIVGGISTPHALYSLQAIGELGWIVDSSTLFVGGDKPIIVTPEIKSNAPEIPNS